MNHKKLFPFVLFIMILFLASCDPQGGGDKPTDYISQIMSGYRGIETTLFSDISSMKSGSSVRSAIKIENHGAYTSDVVIAASTNSYLMNFYPENINYVTYRLTMQARSEVEPAIRSETIPFGLKATDNIYEEDLEGVLKIMTCYDYYGEISESVCLDLDPLNLGQIKKSCSVRNTYGFSGGQGGPVSITSIGYENLEDADGNILPQFDIHIRNNGMGKIRKFGTAEDVCSGNSLGPDSTVVELVDIKFSGFSMSDFECSTTELVYDEEKGENKITCSLKQGRLRNQQGIAYNSDLYVKIRYGYQDDLTKKIIITK